MTSIDPLARVAVVGAGPAGAFTASEIRTRSELSVDIFDRLPTPWGLLRAGVAPDHQDIKRMQARLDDDTFGRGCRFFGNVEVGVDVSAADLMRHYSAVVYATGAQEDRVVGIPGEDLPGCHGGRDFVAWYNGHPDYNNRVFDLSATRAVIIGNGNVSADIARMLVTDPRELRQTDMADHALATLQDSNIREVVIVGRRGASHAAFSSAALRKLGSLQDVEIHVRPQDLETGVDHEGAHGSSFTAMTNLALLREFTTRPRNKYAGKRVILQFQRSPVAIVGDGRVEGIVLRPTEREPIGADPLQTPSAESIETIECGLVLRAIGFRSRAIPGVPFDPAKHIVPNVKGRVVETDGSTVRGVYTTGWVKRGPTGILGTNKRDAQETVTSLVEDLRLGLLEPPAPAPTERIDELLRRRHLDVVDLDGWRAIDAREVLLGHSAKRPRVKMPSYRALLSAARA